MGRNPDDHGFVWSVRQHCRPCESPCHTLGHVLGEGGHYQWAFLDLIWALVTFSTPWSRRSAVAELLYGIVPDVTSGFLVRV